MEKHKAHLNYYMVEAFILGLGFFTVFLFSGAVLIQTILVALLVSLYVVMGCIHHRLHHDMHLRIVLEYIIIGILVFCLFIFLKSGVV